MRERKKNESVQVNRLIESLTCLPNDELATRLEELSNDWNGPRTDMSLWVQLLRHFDAELNKICQNLVGIEGLASLGPEDERFCVAVLKFSWVLMERGSNRHVYMSMDHVYSLLQVVNTSVVLEASRVVLEMTLRLIAKPQDGAESDLVMARLRSEAGRQATPYQTAWKCIYDIRHDYTLLSLVSLVPTNSHSRPKLVELAHPEARFDKELCRLKFTAKTDSGEFREVVVLPDEIMASKLADLYQKYEAGLCSESKKMLLCHLRYSKAVAGDADLRFQITAIQCVATAIAVIKHTGQEGEYDPSSFDSVVARSKVTQIGSGENAMAQMLPATPSELFDSVAALATLSCSLSGPEQTRSYVTLKKLQAIAIKYLIDPLHDRVCIPVVRRSLLKSVGSLGYLSILPKISEELKNDNPQFNCECAMRQIRLLSYITQGQYSTEIVSLLLQIIAIPTPVRYLPVKCEAAVVLDACLMDNYSATQTMLPERGISGFVAVFAQQVEDAFCATEKPTDLYFNVDYTLSYSRVRFVKSFLIVISNVLRHKPSTETVSQLMNSSILRECTRVVVNMDVFGWRAVSLALQTMAMFQEQEPMTVAVMNENGYAKQIIDVLPRLLAKKEFLIGPAARFTALLALSDEVDKTVIKADEIMNVIFKGIQATSFTDYGALEGISHALYYWVEVEPHLVPMVVSYFKSLLSVVESKQDRAERGPSVSNVLTLLAECLKLPQMLVEFIDKDGIKALLGIVPNHTSEMSSKLRDSIRPHAGFGTILEMALRLDIQTDKVVKPWIEALNKMAAEADRLTSNTDIYKDHWTSEGVRSALTVVGELNTLLLGVRAMAFVHNKSSEYWPQYAISELSLETYDELWVNLVNVLNWICRLQALIVSTEPSKFIEASWPAVSVYDNSCTAKLAPLNSDTERKAAIAAELRKLSETEAIFARQLEQTRFQLSSFKSSIRWFIPCVARHASSSLALSLRNLRSSLRLSHKLTQALVHMLSCEKLTEESGWSLQLRYASITSIVEDTILGDSGDVQLHVYANFVQDFGLEALCHALKLSLRNKSLKAYRYVMNEPAYDLCDLAQRNLLLLLSYGLKDDWANSSADSSSLIIYEHPEALNRSIAVKRTDLLDAVVHILRKELVPVLMLDEIAGIEPEASLELTSIVNRVLNKDDGNGKSFAQTPQAYQKLIWTSIPTSSEFAQSFEKLGLSHSDAMDLVNKGKIDTSVIKRKIPGFNLRQLCQVLPDENATYATSLDQRFDYRPAIEITGLVGNNVSQLIALLSKVNTAQVFMLVNIFGPLLTQQLESPRGDSESRPPDPDMLIYRAISAICSQSNSHENVLLFLAVLIDKCKEPLSFDLTFRPVIELLSDESSRKPIEEQGSLRVAYSATLMELLMKHEVAFKFKNSTAGSNGIIQCESMRTFNFGLYYNFLAKDTVLDGDFDQALVAVARLFALLSLHMPGFAEKAALLGTLEVFCKHVLRLAGDVHGMRLELCVSTIIKCACEGELQSYTLLREELQEWMLFEQRSSAFFEGRAISYRKIPELEEKVQLSMLRSQHLTQMAIDRECAIVTEGSKKLAPPDIICQYLSEISQETISFPYDSSVEAGSDANPASVSVVLSLILATLSKTNWIDDFAELYKSRELNPTPDKRKDSSDIWTEFRKQANGFIFMAYMASSLLKSSPEFRAQLMREDSFSIYRMVRSVGELLFVCQESVGVVKEAAVLVYVYQSALRVTLAWLNPCCTEAYELPVGRCYIQRATTLFQDVCTDLNQLLDKYSPAKHSCLEHALHNASKLCLTVLSNEDVQWAAKSKHPVLPQVFHKCNLTNIMFRCLGKLSYAKVKSTLKSDLLLIMQRFGNPVLTQIQTSTLEVSETLFNDDHNSTSQSGEDGVADTESGIYEDAITDGEDDDDFVQPVPTVVPGRRRSSLSTEAFRNSTLGLYTEDASQDEDDFEEVREQSDPQFDEISDDEVMSDVSDENMLSDMAEHEAAVSDFWDDFVPEAVEGEEDFSNEDTHSSAGIEFDDFENSDNEEMSEHSGLETNTEDGSDDNIHYINIDIIEETSDEGDFMSDELSNNSESQSMDSTDNESEGNEREDAYLFDVIDNFNEGNVLDQLAQTSDPSGSIYATQLEKMFNFFRKDHLTNTLAPANYALQSLKHQDVLVKGPSLIHPLHLKAEGLFLNEHGDQSPYFTFKITLISQGQTMDPHMWMFYESLAQHGQLLNIAGDIVDDVLHTEPRLDFASRAIELEKIHIKETGRGNDHIDYGSGASSEESSSEDDTDSGSSDSGSDSGANSSPGSEEESEEGAEEGSEEGYEASSEIYPMEISANSGIDHRFLHELLDNLQHEALTSQHMMASSSANAESEPVRSVGHLAEFFNALTPEQRQALTTQISNSALGDNVESQGDIDSEVQSDYLLEEEARHALRSSILRAKDNMAKPGTYAKWLSSGLKGSKFYKLNASRQSKWVDKCALSALLLTIYDSDVQLRRFASVLTILPKHTHHGQVLMALLHIADAASKGKSSLLACYRSLQEDAFQPKSDDVGRETKPAGNVLRATPAAILGRILQILIYWSSYDREFFPMVTTLTSTKPHKEHVFNALIMLMDTPLVSTSESLLLPTAKLVASIATFLTSSQGEASNGETQTKDPQTIRLTKLFPLHSVRMVCAIPAYSAAMPTVFDEIITCLRAFVKFKDGFSLVKTLLSEQAVSHAADAVAALQPILTASESELPERLNKFIQPSSSQTKLLRVLTATGFALDPENLSETEKATITAKAYSDMLSALIAMPVWPLLSEILSKAPDDKSPIPAALLPLIECVALLSKLIYTFERRTNSRISRKSHALADFGYKHRKILNRLVKSNPKLLRGSFTVFTKDPQIFEFENKQIYFMRKARKEKLRLIESLGQTSHNLTLTVDRESVFLDSFRKLYPRKPDELKAASIKIVFRGEEGVDEGGLSREWYDLLSKQIFDPQYALFKQLEGNSTIYHPSSSSSLNPDHLSYFKFVGRMIGKAVFDGQYMDCYFSRALYKYLLGKPVSLDDMEPVDSSYHQSLCWMLENDITDVIDETFSVEFEEFGIKKLLELKPGGADIAVDEKNKAEYVKLIVQHILVKGVEQQLEHLKIGFTEIVPQKLLALFDEQELELLISGLPDIDIEDWRRNTRYEGYNSSSPQIRWFWRAIASFDQEERARVLQFATGTSRVPPRGMAYLGNSQGNNKFEIARDRGSTSRWPTAHTCMNAIVLPSYESYEKLREMLLRAISNGNASGFGLA